MPGSILFGLFLGAARAGCECLAIEHHGHREGLVVFRSRLGR